MQRDQARQGSRGWPWRCVIMNNTMFMITAHNKTHSVLVNQGKGQVRAFIRPCRPEFSTTPISSNPCLCSHGERRERDCRKPCTSLHDNHRRDLVRSLDASRRASNWGNGWLTLPPALISVSALTPVRGTDVREAAYGRLFCCLGGFRYSDPTNPKKIDSGAFWGVFRAYLERDRGETRPEGESGAGAPAVSVAGAAWAGESARLRARRHRGSPHRGAPEKLRTQARRASGAPQEREVSRRARTASYKAQLQHSCHEVPNSPPP